MSFAEIKYKGYGMYQVLKPNIVLIIMIMKLIHIFSVPKVRNKNVFLVWKGSVSECIHTCVCCC